METVREQLVKKPYKSTDKAMQFFILAMALFIALAVMILASSLLGGIFIIAGLLFAAIVLYGGYYLSGNLNVEYEYCIAGSELSIDKIIDRRKRKTLCTLNLKEAEGFYRGEKELMDATVVSAAGDDDVYTDRKLGKTLIHFSPDERTLEMISPYLPRLS